jgi:Flp pilus assembly protein TadG
METGARANGRGCRSGIALVEFALTSMVLFLFVIIVFDFGIYALTFLSVQNAARAAVLRNSGGLDSAGDQEAACAVVRAQLKGLVSGGPAISAQCDQAPLIVAAELCDGSDSCLGGSPSSDGEPAAAVRVTYSLPFLFLVPTDSATVVVKTVRMKVRNVS